MSNAEAQDVEELVAPDELTSLKERADLMGLKYHPSISLEKMREKVAAAMADSEEAPPEQVVETEGAMRFRMRKEANELVRVRVACMNPAKKEWVGEVFTVGNSVVGSFTKYVAFDAEDGWHVPRIIYNQLVDRKCQVFTSIRDERGNSVRKGKMIREFSIEILPALSVEDLEELARRQALSNAID